LPCWRPCCCWGCGGCRSRSVGSVVRSIGREALWCERGGKMTLYIQHGTWPADTARNGGGQDGAGAFVGLFGRLIDRLGFLRSCLLLDTERRCRATYVDGWGLVCNVG
jgi:hypothetical protein